MIINNTLWEGSSEVKNKSHLHHYMQWLKTEYQLHFETYDALWEWSVNDVSVFWESLWHYFKITSHSPYNTVLKGNEMPNYSWFNGATLNYCEHVFKNYKANQTAIIFANEQEEYLEISWLELKHKVAAMATYLKSIGVKKGDCVAAFLPNIPEATISFLAVNSLGAIWSSTSPDFGVESVIDRFEQIKPKVFITVDGYYYNGKINDKTSIAIAIANALQTVKQVIAVPYLYKNNTNAFPNHYKNINAIYEIQPEPLTFEAVEFNYPIWILYSSGTTGLPKAIVHSHGGILMEHYKYMAFHNDVHQGERFFWFTTTGWMMWNFLQSALLMGAAIVLYDGNPTYKNFNVIWSLAEKTKLHHFGTSAPFLISSMNANFTAINNFNLTALRSISSTGATLPIEAFNYVYSNIKPDVWLCSMAGGTDVCTAFVGGTLLYAVHAGEIQCRALGVSLFAYNDNCEKVEDELGEMIIDKPMPSMPIYFWNDPENKNYIASYFEHYPGIWRHGDFININTKTHGITIYGRSDATLNRHGIRIGTAEIYRCLNKINALEDALIVNLESQNGSHFMPLFVKLKPNVELSDSLKSEINLLLKTDYSPRHVPDEIIEVPDIPYTLSGKKMESPIKKILMKLPLKNAINIDSMKNPEAVNFFIAYAKQLKL